jgi:amidase
MSLAEDYVSRDATALAELVEAAIKQLEQVEPKLAGMAEWTLDQARRPAREPLRDGPFCWRATPPQ